jgi:hypothetical protein
MSIIKMVTSSVGALTVVSSQIDIPAAGVIRTIAGGLTVTQDATPAAQDSVIAELSFLSTSTFTTNDARGSLCQVSWGLTFQDAARLITHGVHFCVLTPIAVKVAAGERMFLHLQANQTDIVANTVFYLFVDDGIDVARSQVRRR